MHEARGPLDLFSRPCGVELESGSLEQPQDSAYLFAQARVKGPWEST